MSYPFPRFPRKVAASGLKVQDVFAATAYTGNGGTLTVTTGVDLATFGGLVWAKDRASVTDHCLMDTVRGGNNVLASDNTAASSFFSAGISAFSSTGFTTGGNNQFNVADENHIAWSFRKAAKFFDVVTYTGTGAAQAINHNLGIAPGLVIVKRTDSTGTWAAWSNGLTDASYFVALNSTNAQAANASIWNSTAPTSSVFTVGINANVNLSGATYVAYLFAHDPDTTNGIIQCGSFTTDASGNATVTLGWEPQLALVKVSSTGGNWVLLEQTRGWASGADATLSPNSSAAENGIFGSVDAGNPSSTGFTVTGNIMPTSQTCIYMAIRKGPM